MQAKFHFWRLRCGLMLLGLSGGLFMSAATAADLPVGRNHDPLIAAIERLEQRPADPDAAVDAARQRLAASIQQLQQYLARANGDTAKAWSEWPNLARLTQELQSENSDTEFLRGLEERLYQNKDGLELPAFVALRRELRALLAADEYAAAASPQELYRQRLAELSERLSHLELEPNE